MHRPQYHEDQVQQAAQEHTAYAQRVMQLRFYAPTPTDEIEEQDPEDEYSEDGARAAEDGWGGVV